MRTLQKTWVRLAVAALGALIVASTGASTALAQNPNDPYGSTSTTRRPPRTATIELSVTTGPPGTEIQAYACGYAPATAGGSITFSGTVVASGLVVDVEGCLTTDGSNPPRFRAPEGSRPGTHQVCAVVAGYNTPCARFRVTNGNGPDAQVLGNQLERSRSGGGNLLAPTDSRSGGGGLLPSTGLAVALLVLLAVGLAVAGRLVIEASRRRADPRA